MRSDRRAFLTAAGTAALAGAFAPGRWLGAADNEPRRAFTPDVEIELVAQPDELQMLPGAPTGVWRYAARVLRGPAEAVEAAAGSGAPPVLRLATGQQVRIRFLNRISQPSIVHWHGLVVPDVMDGHPRHAIAPGADYLYEFEVRNRAGTYWFHPHPDRLTGPQVYGGLAGLLVVSDDEERAARLPDAERDVSIVLADRTFDAGNQLVYDSAFGPGMMGAMMGFFGERILANGRPSLAFPAARGAYRVRVLNGSNSRIYRIARSDRKPVVAIATDGGLLAAPERKPFIVLAPAERVELWLDLHEESDGSRVALTAEPLDFLGGGMMGGRMGPGGGGVQIGAPHPFVLFTVARGAAAQALPARLSTPPSAASWPQAELRPFAITLGRMRWSINGREFVMDEVAPDERMPFGLPVAWEFVNRTPMMAIPHPMHIHATQFHVLEREGTPPGLAWMRAGFVDGGVKDTVLVLPGERVRVLTRFAAFRGLFLYHCHNLVHEDMGMMRNFSVA